MADVFFHPVDGPVGAGADLTGPLGALSGKLKLNGGPASGAWSVKVDVGPRGRRPRIDPAWADAIVRALSGQRDGGVPAGSFCFETLSITTRGLDTVSSLRDLARDKGFGADPVGLPFVVADGPDQGAPVRATSAGGEMDFDLAPGVVETGGLCVLNPVRPHPHAGFMGAVAALGLGGVDRETKIRMHCDIRPSVDTPLCAGCGSCLDVCLFDAIVIASGRAYIDHEKCTGCGECMTVCFMAGIEPEQDAGVTRFQSRLAEAALALRTAIAGPRDGRFAYFNFLFDAKGRRAGARALRDMHAGDVGVLAGTDPVALDQAAWDLICERSEGPLKKWSGYGREPETLLQRAQDLGLGSRTYRLVHV